MTNKEKYEKFCENTFVPIYSKPWWMDAVCSPNSWDVWICEENGNYLAAMPYYVEERNGLKYITKAPLTQNNGIIFNYPDGCSDLSKSKFNERVINKACTYIANLGLDVYEQQYQVSFTNWLPFFWNYYTASVRYTNRIEIDYIDKVWEKISSRKKRNIKKGKKNAIIMEISDTRLFYNEHRKVFLKQGLECPFSFDLFNKLVSAAYKNNSGKMMVARNSIGIITSVMFVVWDDKTMYYLVGGGIPEYQNEESFSYLMWCMIQEAMEKGLIFDFEGSVIKRIAKSNCEYGAVPVPYFRIRKVFNPSVIHDEAVKEVEKLSANFK